MVSGATLFIALFNNLAIFIALVAVYGTLVGTFAPSQGIRRQLALGLAFGLFALGCMNAKIPVATGVIVDQRNAIVALSGAFGGPLSALVTAIIAGFYRAHLGGSGILSGVTGIALSALAGAGLHRWLSPIDTVRKAALAALIATLIILPGFVLVGPFARGLDLMLAMAIPYGTAIFLGIFLVGLLLSREDHRLKAEKRFRKMVEMAPDAILVLDRTRRVRLFNAKAVSLSGVSESNALGRSLSELGWLSGAAQSSLQESLDGLGNSPTAVPPFELQTHDGQCILEANVGALSAAVGEYEWLVVLRDVTERKRAEEVRLDFEARILQSKSLEALGRLAGGVAHDFNNMLTVILTTAELARTSKDRVLEQSLSDDLRSILEAGSKAAELTAQLLAFGRKQVLEPQVLSPNVVVDGLTSLLRRSLPENIALEVKCDPAVVNVTADGARLEQVIVNLAVNARDAMPAGGRLTIATCNSDLDDSYASSHPEVVPGKYVELSVCDTGVGMTEDVVARIFEPFYTTKAPGKGTGLGLATVHGIVRQSGGHVFVYSEPGRGSCFRVYLPATEQPASAVGKAATASLETIAGHVLLVEDNDLVRRPVARMLKGMGLQVTEADGGREALAAMEAGTTRFDILLADVVLRDTTGPELAAEIVKRNPHIRVLHMSGYTEDTMVHQGGLASGFHFIPKPFTRNGLLAAIRKLLA